MIHPVAITSKGKFLNIDTSSEFRKWVAGLLNVIQNQSYINRGKPYLTVTQDCPKTVIEEFTININVKI